MLLGMDIQHTSVSLACNLMYLSCYNGLAPAPQNIGFDVLCRRVSRIQHTSV